MTVLSHSACIETPQAEGVAASQWAQLQHSHDRESGRRQIQLQFVSPFVIYQSFTTADRDGSACNLPSSALICGSEGVTIEDPDG